MHPIRRVRSTHKITITQLALRSGVSARALGAAELGLEALKRPDLERLARTLQVPITELIAPAPQPFTWKWRSLAAVLMGCLLVGLISLLSGMPLEQSTLPKPVQAAANELPVSTRATISTVAPIATQAPVPTSVPRTPVLVAAVIQANDGTPRACPLLAATERVRITQGYGEGSHAPASVAGAIDLGIDADGDGIADPGATDGVVVLATQTGIVHVFPDTWPGGNVIRVVDDVSGWNTLYAHLSSFAVAEGQRVEIGQPIGRVGTTGMSSGPHLHYETWLRGENRDPTTVVACGS